MKKTTAKPKLESVEVVASCSGKLSTAQWENFVPFFSSKEVYTGLVTPEFALERQKALFQSCYEQFKIYEKKITIEKIQEQHKNLRFYPVGDEQYPSVTSIIGWDAEFYVSKEQLLEYSARGTIIHKLVEIYLKTGKWLDPKDVPEVYTQMVILKQGSLGLSLEGYNFVGFKEKYPFETLVTELVVCNREHKYAGRCDIKSVVNGKITLDDVKTGTIDKVKAFKQLSAYAACKGNEDVEQLRIIPLNNTTQQGFSQPIIETDVKKYLPMFLDDRKKFREVFSV